MIDPSMEGTTWMVTATTIPPTVEELEVEINRLNIEIENLTHDRDYWHSRYNTRLSQIEELEQYLKENHRYIDEEVTDRLVEIFALELTKDYDVEITVRFSGTVTVPFNYDMDSLENDLNASLDASYYAGGVEVDFSEDDMSIDWTEN